jgi:uncharacterized membrane protein YraQ (UPF0718 family)
MKRMEQVMSKSSGVLKAIGYAFGASVAASLGVLLVGVCLLGFQLALWAEWEGRIVGLVATVAGVAGAVVGMSWHCAHNREESMHE